jgi:hypothetical protein
MELCFIQLHFCIKLHKIMVSFQKFLPRSDHNGLSDDFFINLKSGNIKYR